MPFAPPSVFAASSKRDVTGSNKFLPPILISEIKINKMYMDSSIIGPMEEKLKRLKISS